MEKRTMRPLNIYKREIENELPQLFGRDFKVQVCGDEMKELGFC